MTTNPTTDELQQHALRAYRGIELGLGEADPVAGVAAKLESQHPGAKTGRPKINILGQRFGRLLAVASVNGGWLCKCDCGVEKIISGGHLRTGRTISCGCYVQEHVKAPKTHGMRYSRVWRIWSGILQRCTNPRHIRYSDYGGRGIKVCDAWLTFNGFFADMGNPPAGTSIDRIDHNGDYTPQNCRWATPKTQARNTRTHRWRRGWRRNAHGEPRSRHPEPGRNKRRPIHAPSLSLPTPPASTRARPKRSPAVLSRDAGFYWINKRPIMKINEIAFTLEAWRGRREVLDAQLDALSLLTMAAPECPLFSAIEDIWMAYTVSVSQIVGDKAEWLQWYWLERDMGNKPGEVTVSGQDGAETIVVGKNIRSLAEVIARVKP